MNIVEVYIYITIYARFAEGNTCKCAENGRNVAILGQASLGQPPPRSSFVSAGGVYGCSGVG